MQPHSFIGSKSKRDSHGAQTGHKRKDSALTTQRQTVMWSHAESLAVGIAVDSMSSLLCAAWPFYTRFPQNLIARVYEEELQDSRSS